MVEVGGIFTIRFGLGAVLALPAGSLADAWGTRRVLAFGVGGSALASLIPILGVLSSSVLPLYAWAIVSGLTSAMIWPANGAYVAAHADSDRRGSAFGWLTFSSNTGSGIGPAIGGLTWDTAGAIPTYLAAAVIGSIALVGPLFLAGSVRGRVDLRSLRASIGTVARYRLILGCWAVALGLGFSEGALRAIFPLFGTSIGLSASSIGWLLGILAVSNGLSRVPLGRVIDRRVMAPVAASIGCAFYSGTSALLGFQSGFVGIAIVFVVGSVAVAFTHILLQVTITNWAPANLRATALGGYLMSDLAGIAGGPIIAGGVAERMGFGPGFATVAACGLLLAAVSVAILAPWRAASRSGSLR